MSGGCCSAYRDEDVLAWVLGDVAGEKEHALLEHLGECPGCRERAAEYTRIDRSAGCCRSGDVIRWRGFETPFGLMRIASSPEGLVELSWKAPSDDAFVERLERRYPSAPVVCDCDQLDPAERQLLEYFDRKRRRFEVPVDLRGVTDFQRSVLRAAAGIGFGEVATYSDIAGRIGKPGASRAVGNALGQNPVAIIVPCHRVVRTDGSLGGYTGGLRYKEALLDIEGRSDLFAGMGAGGASATGAESA